MSVQPKILLKRDLDKFSISIRNDGIVQVDITNDVEINIENLQEGVTLLKVMGKGKRFPILFVAGA